MSAKFTHLVLAVLFSTVAVTRGQQAVSSITQSRLFTTPAAPGTISYDANGNPLPDNAATSSGDESFGTQIILKSQERPKNFSVFGDVSSFYTTNVDLTPNNTRSDFFLAASAGAVRLIRSMLYETRPLDPSVFAAVTAMLFVVAALACIVPAWRASRVDPMQALRTE